jgi:hypothetical protein
MSQPPPFPSLVEIYLTSGSRRWRGELHDGRLKLEVQGDTPEAVLAELVRQYHEPALEYVRRVPGNRHLRRQPCSLPRVAFL